MNGTPEYRREPITGRWVIIAPERSQRPLGLASTKPHTRLDTERDSCPFCEGREDQSPPEVLAYRAPGTQPDGPGWSLRVVPNKYPAVRDDCEGPTTNGFHEARPAFGHHEVVIECPFHEANPARFCLARLTALFIAYRERLAALAADLRVQYVSIFKNVGAEAGASLAHSHSQVLATAVVPEAIQAEFEGTSRAFAESGRCLYCEAIAQAESRIVAESPGFVVLAPYASRFAYELWVLPRSHSSRYESLTDAEAADLAGVIKPLLGKLDAVLSYPAYNWYIRTGPARSGPLPSFHWHLQLSPRTSRVAGFEWATGCFINPVPPERAAEELRRAVPPPETDAPED